MSWLIFLIFLLLKKLELFVCSTFPSTCFQRWEVETGLKNVKRLTTVEQPSEGPCGFSTWLTFAPSCHVFFRLAKISHPLSSFFFYFFFFSFASRFTHPCKISRAKSGETTTKVCLWTRVRIFIWSWLASCILFWKRIINYYY